MLKNHAYGFAVLCSRLEFLEARLFTITETSLPKDHEEIASGRQLLSYAKSNCALLQSQTLIAEIERIENELEMDSTVRDRYRHNIEHLNNHIRDALKTEMFLHVHSSVSHLYGNRQLFGADVLSKFPKSIEDVESAGNCLALGQPTACVFHLMRVMEDGVQSLGRKLKVRIDVKVETWHQILEHVDMAIASMPNKTSIQRKRKETRANTSVLLSHVRIAWRNDVMHPKKAYTLEEAKEVFDAAKAFMRHLARLV